MGGHSQMGIPTQGILHYLRSLQVNMQLPFSSRPCLEQDMGAWTMAKNLLFPLVGQTQKNPNLG